MRRQGTRAFVPGPAGLPARPGGVSTPLFWILGGSRYLEKYVCQQESRTERQMFLVVPSEQVSSLGKTSWRFREDWLDSRKTRGTVRATTAWRTVNAGASRATRTLQTVPGPARWRDSHCTERTRLPFPFKCVLSLLDAVWFCSQGKRKPCQLRPLEQEWQLITRWVDIIYSLGVRVSRENCIWKWY